MWYRKTQAYRLFFLLALSAGVALPQVGPRITVDDSQHGLAAAGEARTFRVTVLDVNGAPAAGQTVAFVSLATGPGVDFGIERSFVRATTDSAGVAEAAGVVRGVPGPFLVEATLEGGDLDVSPSATIALTVPSAAAQPSLDAAAARAAVAGAFVTGEARLHGPVWLSTGAAVFSGGPVPVFDDSQPRAVETPHWFFWIDEQPDAEFSHPTRFLFVPDNSSDPAADALVIDQSWWPDVIEPGQDGPRSLAPPAYFNTPYLDSTAPAAAAISAPRVGAPDDACAVIAIGPGLSGGRGGAKLFRDYLINNDLVNEENIADKTSTIGDSTFDRPATRRDLQQMLISLAGKNCRKFYLYINAHGSSPNTGDGGGIELAGPDSNPEQLTELVPYEDLITMLEPFRQAEMCVLISSCHSGQLISWFDGRGFMGVVAMSASAEKSSYTTRAGPWYIRGFLEAAQNDAADANNDGMVTFVEAHAYLVVTTSNDSITDPMPSTFTINQGGPRTMTIPNIDVFAEGGRERIEIRRPDSAPSNEPFNFTLTVQDTGIGNFTQQMGTIPAGQDSVRVSFRGTDCGETTYRVNGQDSTGAAYEAMAKVQVSDIRLSQKVIELDPGQTATVDITRYGFWFDRGTSTMVTLTPSTQGVATVPAMVSMAGGEAMKSFTVTAVAPGETRITLNDSASFSIKHLTVRVRAPQPPPTTGCAVSGQSDVSFAVKPGGDTDGHDPFVNLKKSLMNFQIVDSQILIDGNAPQTPQMSGTFNPTDCTFTANGNSGSTQIAGFTNVDVQILDGSINQVNLSLNFDYRLGSNGVFPGGNPITYVGQGTLIPDDPGSGGVLTPPSASFLPAGGSNSVFVNFDDGVAWALMIQRDTPWIVIDGPLDHTGPHQIDYNVLPNNSRAERNSGILFLPNNGPPVEFPIFQQGSQDSNLPLIIEPSNGATFQDGFTSNGWTTISGSNLSQTTREWGVDDFLTTQPLTDHGTVVKQGAFLPIQLDGVSVKINGQPAYVRFVSPGQINVLSPEDPSLGSVEIEVETPAGGSNLFTVTKRPAAPELFRFNPFDGRYAIAVHPDGTLAGREDLFQTLETRPAQSGDVLVFYGTGFGPTDPPAPAGQLVTGALWLKTPLAARIGGVPAEVLFAGLVPGTGLYQVNLIVPNLEPGDHLLELFTDGKPLQLEAYLTVGE